MTLRLAVFDIAGTTVKDDDAVAEAFSKAFSSFGYEVSREMVTPLMGYKKTTAIEMVLEQMHITWDAETVSGIHDAFVDLMKDHYATATEVQMFESAENVLHKLREKGFKIAMNTGFSRSIADVIVHRFQWMEKGLIDGYVGSDEVISGRPDPAMIRLLMEKLNIHHPQEIVKIGDTEVDIREGRNAHCGLVVAVTTGAFSREELEPYHPDHIIDDLSELPAIIEHFA